MITLIYGSTATHRMTETELIQILETARRNNVKENITGMLLYDDGNFLQVLEGEEKPVTSSFNKISQDTRHNSVMVYVKKSIESRQFDDWAMGFVDVKRMGADKIPGYTNFLQDPQHNTKLKDASYAHAFLNVFRENIR